MGQVVIAPECPWYGLYKTFGPPNVHWCEEILCSYVNNPANTWSNIGYIFLAFWILKKYRKDGKFEAFYGWTLLFTGLSSAFYHATNNYLTQFFDFLGMFALVSSIIVFNFKRLGLTKDFSFRLFGVIVLFFTMAFFGAKYLFPVQFLIVIGIGGILIQEGILFFTQRARSFALFGLAIFLLALAQLFSQLDLHRIWCEPKNHIILQGHALWHFIASMALGVYFFYLKKQR